MNIRSITRLIGGGRPRRLVLPAVAIAAMVTVGSLVGCTPPYPFPIPTQPHGGITWSCGIVVFPSKGIGCKIGWNFSWNSTLSNATVDGLAATNLSTVFTAQNVAMNDGTYSAVVALYDQNGNLLASDNANVYVSGGTGYLSDPEALATWVEAHDAQARSMQASVGIPYTVTNPNAKTGQVTATGYVGNVAGDSATSTFVVSCKHQKPDHICAVKG